MDQRRGSFANNEPLLVRLNESVTLDKWEMAWRGPKQTKFELQAQNQEGAWETVLQGEGTGEGQSFSIYEFAPTSSAAWRLCFAEHQDERKDKQEKRLQQSLQVYELRLGGLKPEAYAYFSAKNFWRHHSLQVSGPQELRWIAASGVKDLRKLVLPAVFDPAVSYELTLVFAEPELSRAGERRFDVQVQGRKLGETLDLFEESGSLDYARTLVCQGLRLSDSLQVELLPLPGSSQGPVLCGFELRQEQP
ncbi:MAG: malectin domain-containing carbohydrate-binding protein [Lentisphaeria bacterium]|nr:malectin domain-containing carbohydrate-binding protein [Lentisphaeria bacterium]